LGYIFAIYVIINHFGSFFLCVLFEEPGGQFAKTAHVQGENKNKKLQQHSQNKRKLRQAVYVLTEARSPKQRCVIITI
jgi:hypothetical protein